MAKNKNIKSVSAGKKNNIEEQCQELVNDLERMVKARDKNLEASKEQLVSQLDVTSDKYRTATGVLEALRVIRIVNDEPSDDIPMACELADSMANEAAAMKSKAEKLGYAEMDQLCDDFYVKDYANAGEYSVVPLAFELMRLDLCRNVGPAAEDIVAFGDRVDIELAEVTAKLDELDPDWAEKYEPTKE